MTSDEQLICQILEVCIECKRPLTGVGFVGTCVSCTYDQLYSDWIPDTIKTKKEFFAK